MKTFYGQMTRDELKGAIYSGEYLKEFADMCEAVALVESRVLDQCGKYKSICTSFTHDYMPFYYCPSSRKLTANIQWQPEPDKDLLKIVELCGGVWPERNPYYLQLGVGGQYTQDQFEAAKVWLDRESVRKFTAGENNELDVFVNAMNNISSDELNKQAREIFNNMINKTPAIKNGSWINIDGLTQEQAQYCVDWLAEKTGKESWIAGPCEHDKVAVYYKDCDIIQSHLDGYKLSYKDLEIKATDILPDEIKQKEKPPIGVMPKSIWLSKRKEEVQAAIDRYVTAGLEPLPEWKEEINWINGLTASNQSLEIDQTVYTFREDELTVYRIENGKHLLSDLKWYSPDDLTGCKQTSIVQRIIKDHVDEINDGIEIQDKGNRETFKLAKNIIDSLN